MRDFTKLAGMTDNALKTRLLELQLILVDDSLSDEEFDDRKAEIRAIERELKRREMT